MHQVIHLCSRFPSVKVSQKTVKKPKLSTIMKKQKHKPKKKPDYIESSDDDFVEQCPGPSKSSHQSSKQLSGKELKKQKNREKVAKWRENRSTKHKETDRKTDAEKHASKRASETKEEHDKRINEQAKRQATLRANETTEDHQERVNLQAQRQASSRANETPDEHQERNRINAERQASLRANQTQEQQLKERSTARERMTAARNYSSAGYREAARSQDILQGKLKVEVFEFAVSTNESVR